MAQNNAYGQANTLVHEVSSMETLNIVVVGVGGQGLISLASIIASAALRKGYNAIVAETHGLSQRGGTVIVHVRLGDAEAPLIPPKTANVLLAMELIEANRYLYYLSPNGVIVVNDYIVPPPLPKIKIPARDELLENLKETSKKLILVQATEEALKLGDARVANMVLLGAALQNGLLRPFVDFESIKEAIIETWPKAADINIKALEVGSNSYSVFK